MAHQHRSADIGRARDGGMNASADIQRAHQPTLRTNPARALHRRRIRLLGMNVHIGDSTGTGCLEGRFLPSPAETLLAGQSLGGIVASH
ncbi:MAG TPA: hypothetical protein DGG94_02835, partial [Micromonosporaceae bacterium]|nr:hypothetical protein [Micromonosporaceae bacterium]